MFKYADDQQRLCTVTPNSQMFNYHRFCLSYTKSIFIMVAQMETTYPEQVFKKRFAESKTRVKH